LLSCEIADRSIYAPLKVKNKLKKKICRAMENIEKKMNSTVCEYKNILVPGTFLFVTLPVFSNQHLLLLLESSHYK